MSNLKIGTRAAIGAALAFTVIGIGLVVLNPSHFGLPPARGDYLLPDVGERQASFHVALGEPLFAHLWDMNPRQGAKPVHFLKIELLGVPHGMVVDRVVALNIFKKGGVGGDRGVEALNDIGPAMVPIGDVTILPKCPNGALICYPWYTIVQYHLVNPGAYTTTGMRVTYEVDGTVYYQDFNKRVAATTGDKLTLPPFP